MLMAIITGMTVGFVLSILTGPTFFSLLQVSVGYGFMAGLSFAFGVFLSDTIYISASVYGLYLLSFENQYHNYISLLGGSFLLCIGAYYLFKRTEIHYQPPKAKRNTGFFIKGFFMCLLNPVMLVYWLAISSKYVTDRSDSKGVFAFFTAVLLTILASDAFKAYLASRYRSKIKASYIHWVSKIAGIIILLYALKMIVEVLLDSCR